MVITANIEGIKTFAVKLQALNKSAFPVAIRQTLNSAAFDVKQTTMPAGAASKFTQRRPNFFKATSKTIPAKGFDIKTMQSITGFVGKGSNQQAVDDLQQQEKGGTIGGRSFIATDVARAGTSKSKPVRANARLRAIKNIVQTKNARGKNEGQRFIKSALFAGKGGHVLANYKGLQVLWRVNKMERVKGKRYNKLTPLYTFSKGRNVNVTATGFMESAALQSAKKINVHFITHAKAQFQKALSK